MSERPRIAITMGDAAGIGPEILARALANKDLQGRCVPVVVGATWAIEDAVDLIGANVTVRRIGEVDDATGEPDTIEVLDLASLTPEDAVPGKISAACGRAAVESIESASSLALEGRVRAIVTCPIHKEAVHAAGFIGDIGHQEILARVTGAKLTATILMNQSLRVAHVSTHKSLIEAARYVTKDNVLAKLRLTAESLTGWGIPRPRIAVSALNPHGGEGGLLGREEIDEIVPAVNAALAEDLDIVGPYPADSVFHRAIKGEFDAVLALYHDQGHIAIKVQHFEESVTATMGIPFVRTSVDHGTAFDIAGQGIANETSLTRAIDAAITLARGELRSLRR